MIDTGVLRDGLGPVALERLRAYGELLAFYNRKVNLVSRETIGGLWEQHIRHTLALHARRFAPGSTVVDWGAGGGLPSIPLAIVQPDVQVVAVDAVEKKVQAIRAMARTLGLGNLEAWAGRAEQWPGKADYSVSRATAPLAALWAWHARAARPAEATDPDAWRPGLIALKGGNLVAEIAALRAAANVTVHRHPIAPTPLLQQKYALEVYPAAP